MNKQEAIEEIKKQSTQAYDDFAIMRDTAIHIINQIDEPHKPVVPKFVAEWLEETRAEEYSLYGAWEMVKEGSEIFWWLFDGHESNQDTFNRAWLDGYEIEKEKLYTVEIPNPNRTTEPIIYLSRDERGKIFLNSWFLLGGQNWKKHHHSHLTEAEIKQDFEWAWNAGFAKEVNNADD